MHPVQNDLSGVRPVYVSSSGANATLGLGGTSTHLLDDKFGSVVDRLSFSRLYRAGLVFAPIDLTLASSAVLTVEVGVQSAAASSGTFADVGSRVTRTIGTAASSDTAPSFAVPWGVINMAGANRYIRPVIQLATLTGATSSGQQVVVQAPCMVVGGVDEAPADTRST